MGERVSVVHVPAKRHAGHKTSTVSLVHILFLSVVVRPVWSPFSGTVWTDPPDVELDAAGGGSLPYSIDVDSMHPVVSPPLAKTPTAQKMRNPGTKAGPFLGECP